MTGRRREMLQLWPRKVDLRIVGPREPHRSLPSENLLLCMDPSLCLNGTNTQRWDQIPVPTDTLWWCTEEGVSTNYWCSTSTTGEVTERGNTGATRQETTTIDGGMERWWYAWKAKGYYSWLLWQYTHKCIWIGMWAVYKQRWAHMSRPAYIRKHYVWFLGSFK